MRRWSLVALLSVPGCFYTEVINLPPHARIERVAPMAPVYIGGPEVALTARASNDDNGDALTYEWLARTCLACPTVGASGLADFKVTATSHEPIRVNLTVTDDNGAFSTAFALVPVDNRLPEVVVQAQAQGTPKVTQPIVFVAEGSDPDGDRLSYEFKVFPPPGSPVGYQFMRDSAQSYTLIPDAPGTWEVQVTAEDEYGGRTTQSRMVTVEGDSPPCIAATTPAWTPDARVILLRSAGPRRFAVDSVTDDLDPWPGSDAVGFRWLVGPPGALTEVMGHDLPDLVVDPSDLDPGETLEVRVEVSDRAPRVLPCDVGQAVCPEVSCPQRLTWTAEVR